MIVGTHEERGSHREANSEIYPSASFLARRMAAGYPLVAFRAFTLDFCRGLKLRM